MIGATLKPQSGFSHAKRKKLNFKVYLSLVSDYRFSSIFPLQGLPAHLRLSPLCGEEDGTILGLRKDQHLVEHEFDGKPNELHDGSVIGESSRTVRGLADDLPTDFLQPEVTLGPTICKKWFQCDFSPIGPSIQRVGPTDTADG